MFGLGKQGNGIGFHRILRFYNYANIPRDFFSERSIVITGSNGKGSTIRFIYALLQTKFSKVGCFTSPHLVDITERFEINGTQITHAALDHYVDHVLQFNKQLLAEGDSLGAFELLFCVAMHWFFDQQVDCVAWEAGIGGRYDPTRAVFVPVSALTSLDLEHTELLGSTKELIAYDKLDVTCKGGESVISASVEPALTERLRAYGAVTGKTFHFISEQYEVRDVAVIDGQQRFTVHTIADSQQANDLSFSLSLIGMHQIENALAALETTRLFLSRHNMSLSPDEAQSALLRVRWPGRMEQISHVPDIWIDVGHTPDALRRVIDSFLMLYKREDIILVYGISYNKDILHITELIESHFDRIILTKAYKNGTDIDKLEATITDKQKIVASFNRIEDAVAYAVKLGAETGKTILVLGGLFLAVEFKTAFQGTDPQALKFF